jgi:hypothetical protein
MRKLQISTLGEANPNRIQCIICRHHPNLLWDWLGFISVWGQPLAAQPPIFAGY